MVRQILTFARGGSGNRILVQVRHILEEIEQVLQSSFPKNISVQIGIDSSLHLVLADATQLQQVFMNLCVNARDAMPEGGVLTLFAENIQINEQSDHWHREAQVGSCVVVTIADTGMGMSQALSAKIFDPFFTTKEVGKGTGSGLSTAAGISKSHNGFIRVDSEEGEGSRFRVCLPTCESSHVESVVEDKESIGHGEMILIVDDEMMIREMTKTALNTYNYQVVTASNGHESIEKYAQHMDEIQLVVVDMMMPSMSGAQTIAALVKLDASVRIIATSGLAPQTAFPHNVRRFLSKPYSIQDLLTAIEESLKEASTAS